MSKCLSMDTITVRFKDKSMLQVTANDIKHACVRETHFIEAKYTPDTIIEEIRTYKFKDSDVEEIVQSWHERTLKEVK